MIELGKEAFDIATGFTGIITAQARHLGGHKRYQLAAKSKDDEAGKTEWFDEGRIQMTPTGQEAGTGFGYKRNGDNG